MQADIPIETEVEKDKVIEARTKIAVLMLQVSKLLGKQEVVKYLPTKLLEKLEIVKYPTKIEVANDYRKNENYKNKFLLY